MRKKTKSAVEQAPEEPKVKDDGAESRIFTKDGEELLVKGRRELIDRVYVVPDNIDVRIRSRNGKIIIEESQ